MDGAAVSYLPAVPGCSWIRVSTSAEVFSLECAGRFIGIFVADRAWFQEKVNEALDIANAERAKDHPDDIPF